MINKHKSTLFFTMSSTRRLLVLVIFVIITLLTIVDLWSIFVAIATMCWASGAWILATFCILISLYQLCNEGTSSNISSNKNDTHGVLWKMIFPLFKCFKQLGTGHHHWCNSQRWHAAHRKHNFGLQTSHDGWVQMGLINYVMVTYDTG